MASIARPSVLRELPIRTPTKCFVQINTRPVSNFALARTTPRPLMLSARPTTQSKSLSKSLAFTARVAAFHATGRRNILPPLPRMFPALSNSPDYIHFEMHGLSSQANTDNRQNDSAARQTRRPPSLPLTACTETTTGLSNA